MLAAKCCKADIPDFSRFAHVFPATALSVCVPQGFSDRMYPFLYDSQTGEQYSEVVREHQLGSPLSSSAPKHFNPAGTDAHYQLDLQLVAPSL